LLHPLSSNLTNIYIYKLQDHGLEAGWNFVLLTFKPLTPTPPDDKCLTVGWQTSIRRGEIKTITLDNMSIVTLLSENVRYQLGNVFLR
jgi:hypothetical protein